MTFVKQLRGTGGHRGIVSGVDFHPCDPNRLVSNGWDHTAIVWDIFKEEEEEEEETIDGEGEEKRKIDSYSGVDMNKDKDTSLLGLDLDGSKSKGQGFGLDGGEGERGREGVLDILLDTHSGSLSNENEINEINDMAILNTGTVGYNDDNNHDHYSPHPHPHSPPHTPSRTFLGETSGHVVAKLRGHSSAVTCAKFSNDGEIIASSAYFTIKLWVLCSNANTKYTPTSTNKYVSTSTSTSTGEKLLCMHKHKHKHKHKPTRTHTRIKTEAVCFLTLRDSSRLSVRELSWAQNSRYRKQECLDIWLDS